MTETTQLEEVIQQRLKEALKNTTVPDMAKLEAIIREVLDQAVEEGVIASTYSQELDVSVEHDPFRGPVLNVAPKKDN